MYKRQTQTCTLEEGAEIIISLPEAESLAVLSSSIPMNSSPSQHSSRSSDEFSPIPPVKQTAVSPPMAAA